VLPRALYTINMGASCRGLHPRGQLCVGSLRACTSAYACALVLLAHTGVEGQRGGRDARFEFAIPILEEPGEFQAQSTAEASRSPSNPAALTAAGSGAPTVAAALPSLLFQYCCHLCATSLAASPSLCLLDSTSRYRCLSQAGQVASRQLGTLLLCTASP